MRPEAGDRPRARRHLATLPRALGNLMIAVPAGTDRQPCCRSMRNALAYVPKGQHTPRLLPGRRPPAPDRWPAGHRWWLRRCAKPSSSLQDSARQTWRQVADQLRPAVVAPRPFAVWGKDVPLSARSWPKLAALMDESELDVLAYMGFPTQHRTKLHSTNPLERLNKEVKRRADVVGIFPTSPPSSGSSAPC